jgi:hypothetical protein
LERHQQQIENAGLQSVVCGQGEPKHAVRYCDKLAPGSECLVRDDTTAYTAYGLEQGGMGELLNVGLLAAGVRSLAGGHLSGVPIGDVKMMPGTFIVDKDGTIRFAYYSQHAGDHPSFEDIFKAVKSL